MKHLKIGSSSSCDIVLHSEFVSAHHADITILDNGDILLEDKGSSNGTYVGINKKKLNPGSEIQIHRGDLVVLADTELHWAKIPVPEKNSQYKNVINIGSNFRNDIVLSNGYVSRFHAVLKIDNNGKAFIVDNRSTNGTEVNGVKIIPEKPYRIHKGDNVVCGDADITEQIKPYLKNEDAWMKWFGAVLAVSAIVLLVYFIVPLVSGGSDPKRFRPAIAYVYTLYHYNISLKDKALGLDIHFTYPSEEHNLFVSQATAFFIDKKGHMATCRHVAKPYDEAYRTDDIYNELKRQWKTYLHSLLPTKISNREELKELVNSKLGNDLANSAYNLNDLNAKLQMLFNSDLEISGEIDHMYIGYSGRKYTEYRDFDIASVTCESGDVEKDVAIIQLNKMETPADVELFDINKVFMGSIEPMKETLYTMGYPGGILRAKDVNLGTIEPTFFEGKCSKVPGKYTYELTHSSTGGASGSPVFDKKGRLWGIVSAGFTGTGATTISVRPQLIKELYDKEVGAYESR